MSSRLLWILLLLVLPAGSALAQQAGTIRGVVTSEDGEPLPGASVRVVDTQLGAATNVEGVYEIPGLSAGNYQVAATFVGFVEVTQQVTVTAGGTATANFTLGEGVQLEGISVDALGFAQNADELGTANSNVAGEALLRSGETNVLRALSAKAPGIDITASGGDPGASTRITIRGNSTIQGSNQPLIVLDGVPISNSSLGGGTDGVQQQSRLNDINPDDIESVEVLKSSSAAALWGSRALNGVIVITTRSGRGRANRPNVSFRSSLSIDEVNQNVPLQDEYGGGFTGKYQFVPTAGFSWGDRIADRSGGPDDFNDGPGAPAARGVQTGEIYYTIPNGTAANTHGGKNDRTTFDNIDTILQTGTYFDNTLSVSGGDEGGRFFLSAANLNQDGIIVENSNYQRTSFRVNLERYISSALTVDGQAAYVRSASDRVQQGSNLNGLLLGGLRTRPDFDITDYLVDYYPNGLNGAFQPNRQRAYRNPLGANNSSIYDNPLYTINQNTDATLVNRFQGKVGASYDAYSWLNLTARLGADYYTDRRQTFFDIFAAGANNGGSASEQSISEFQVNADIIARATRELTSDISASLLAGFNINHREFDNVGGSLIGFTLPVRIRSLDNAESTNTAAFTGQSVRRTLGAYAELDLDLYDQLFLKFTGRADNASTFGPEAGDTFFYPSASVAWQFSDLLEGTFNPLSFGKLRASYGEVGREPDPYLAFTYFFPATVGDGYTSFSVLEASAYGGGYTRSARLGSPTLVPERKREFEVGGDLRFFDDNYSFSATYYNNRSDDVIFSIDVAPSRGFTVQTANAAEIENTGVELSFDAQWPRVGDFSWNTYASWYTNDNTVLDLAGVQEFSLAGFTSLTSSLVEGEPFGVLFGNRWRRAPAGCTEDTPRQSCEPLTATEQAGGFVVGDDNIVIDADGFPVQAATQGIVGDPNADWRASIGNTLRYGDVSLNALFDFKVGGDVWNGTQGALSYFGRAGFQDWYTTVTAAEVANARDWFGQSIQDLVALGESNAVDNGDGTFSFRGYLTDFGGGPVIINEYYFWSGPGSGFTGPSEPFIEDGSYVRLRELTLAYNWKGNIIERLGLSSVDLSVTGRNLALWTDYTGVDPETNLTGPSNGQGLDYFNNPATRSYQFSVRFNY